MFETFERQGLHDASMRYIRPFSLFFAYLNKRDTS